MKHSRIHLLAACAVSSFVASAAQAQVVLPAAELDGAGASSVAEIQPRMLNCVGNPGAGLNKRGDNAGALTTIAPGLYNPAVPSATNPIYDCNTQEIQPNTEGKYISTGSGAGREMWRTFQTATTLDGTPSKINPFTGGAGVPSGWSNLQFAFSDAPASVSDLNTYNTSGTGPVVAGGTVAAIQIPFYVLPVSVAYNPVYGFNGGGTPMTFKVKVPVSINGTVAGGLRLNKSAYCKIFNGEITNWNDAALRTLNGNTSLADTTNDTLARFQGTLVGGVWNGEGVPIRLVGRADKSGTTDIFTRALSAQCGGLVTVNKFVKAAESLPYDNTSTIDIRKLRSDSNYFPGSGSGNFSGTVQSLGGRTFDGTNICNWDELNASKICDIAVKGTITNTGTPQLFLVADGSGKVATAINSTAGNTLLPGTGVTLNGKLGYVGADFVVPAPTRVLFSAALQKGTTAAYVLPSATNASGAFGTTIFPPETTATSGAWSPKNGAAGDQRQVGSVDPYQPISGLNPGTDIKRSNPLHWAAALYNPNVASTLTLANPAAGYPITGVTFLLTNTCFKPPVAAVPGNNPKRFSMVEFVGLSFGKITKNSANTAVSANTFKGTGATNLGIISQANIAVPAAGWVNAIWETFMKKSAQAGSPGGVATTLGAQNLWIQDATPTTALDVDAIQQATDQKSNPSCNANLGA